LPTHKKEQKTLLRLKFSAEKPQREHNTGLAKWRMMCFYDTLVVKQTVVLLMNFGAKNPPLSQARNRYGQYYQSVQLQAISSL